MTNTERLAGLTDVELASEVERLRILGPRQVVQVLAAAMDRLRRPAPKALAEAWVLVSPDGQLVTVLDDEGHSGPSFFDSQADALRIRASARDRVVRVQVVEVPS